MNNFRPIRRALISLSDKSNLPMLASELHRREIEILSTGGTLKAIEALGIPVLSVATYTNSPELFDGRVKTLHPKIHAGILHRRGNAKDQSDLSKMDAQSIDLVVVNLYPFESALENENATEAEMIEEIDVGGPSLLRGAAKNHDAVTVLCDPIQYDSFLAELIAHDGATSLEFRRNCAAMVFARTATYDAAIANYLAPVAEKFPERVAIGMTRLQSLRYGENPHQEAALYQIPGTRGASLTRATILSGKELSYNNYADLDACLEMLLEFTEPFACLIKHANPCGAAIGNTAAEAYTRALATDPLSAFGSIIGVNRPVDIETAKVIHETEFVECVVAPSFSEEALALMSKKKARRLLALHDQLDQMKQPRFQFKGIRGGFLVQTPDIKITNTSDLKVVTRKLPSEAELRDLLFAWRVVKQTKSNAIVLAKDGAATGIGMGQTSRVDSVYMAIKRAGERSFGSVMASDAFFPKTDNIALASEAGIVAIIHPGGSKADEEVLAAADEAGISMILTGVRHFRH